MDCCFAQFAARVATIVLAILILFGSQLNAAEPLHQNSPPAGEKYVLDYPIAQRFCPPVESYFDDVSQSFQQVNGHTFTHQLNGGYGLPVVIMVGNQNLLHLGADVCWMRPGYPVYAIADGVVRMSAGPSANSASTKSNYPHETAAGNKNDTAPDETANSAAKAKPVQKTTENQGWGNIVVIEHHLPDGTYVTSIYGHLSSRRLVEAGDVVQAGQVLGFEGKQGIENGFYKPHVHFGVRDGRMFAPGDTLFESTVNGKMSPVKILHMSETEIEVEADAALPATVPLPLGGHDFALTTRDDRRWLSAGVLNFLPARRFAITGYGLSTDGWRDPTEFLRQMVADVSPARFGAVPRAIARKPSP